MDAVAIAIANGVTSLFSGCVVFAILGYMAHEAGQSVLDVVKEGPGLAFLVYPEVVTKLPSAGLMAMLFFTMLISLALGKGAQRKLGCANYFMNDSQGQFLELLRPSLQQQRTSFRSCVLINLKWSF